MHGASARVCAQSIRQGCGTCAGCKLILCFLLSFSVFFLSFFCFLLSFFSSLLYSVFLPHPVCLLSLPIRYRYSVYRRQDQCLSGSRISILEARLRFFIENWFIRREQKKQNKRIQPLKQKGRKGNS